MALVGQVGGAARPRGEPQGMGLVGRYVLVQYPNDEELLWHERLVLARVAGRRWVTASPDFDVGAEDLSTPPLSAIRV